MHYFLLPLKINIHLEYEKECKCLPCSQHTICDNYLCALCGNFGDFWYKIEFLVFILY